MKNKKILLSLIIFFCFAGVVYISHAGTGENATGWLWGGSDDGAGNNTGLGWISMNDINPTSGGGSYGVNIPDVSCSGAGCNLSGYAWSSNVGWINFNGAQRSGNMLTGWAKITSIETAAAAGNSGGWQGQISLSGNATNGNPYGVSIDPATNKLSGYAWSDELGWIDFRLASINVPVATDIIKICSACTTGNSQLVSVPVTIGVPVSVKACRVASTSIDCNGTDITAVALWGSDSAVASVANGTITGNSVGPAMITATDTDGLAGGVQADVTAAAPICDDGVTYTYQCISNIGCNSGDCGTTKQDICMKMNICMNPVGAVPQINCVPACSSIICPACASSNGGWKEVSPN